MTMTVAELKEVVNISIDDMIFTDLKSFEVLYYDADGTKIRVDEAGEYEVAISNVDGDAVSYYFGFIARGLGSKGITYLNLKNVLNKVNDSSLVYLYMKLKTIPEVDSVVVPIENAVLNVTKISSVNLSGSDIYEGVLLLNGATSSSSSSSSI